MSKYVLANVEIPIEIKEDGNIDTLHSYAQIEIKKEISSPEDIITQNLPTIQTQIDNLFNQKDKLSNSCLHTNDSKNELENDNDKEPSSPKEDLIILKTDIKKKEKKMLNTTFKDKKSFKHNSTAKKY